MLESYETRMEAQTQSKMVTVLNMLRCGWSYKHAQVEAWAFVREHPHFLLIALTYLPLTGNQSIKNQPQDTCWGHT